MTLFRLRFPGFDHGGQGERVEQKGFREGDQGFSFVLIKRVVVVVRLISIKANCVGPFSHRRRNVVVACQNIYPLPQGFIGEFLVALAQFAGGEFQRPACTHPCRVPVASSSVVLSLDKNPSDVIRAVARSVERFYLRIFADDPSVTIFIERHVNLARAMSGISDAYGHRISPRAMVAAEYGFVDRSTVIIGDGVSPLRSESKYLTFTPAMRAGALEGWHG